MFFGAHLSNSIAESGCCKTYLRIGGFCEKLARMEAFPDPYSPPSFGKSLEVSLKHRALRTTDIHISGSFLLDQHETNALA